MSDTPVTPRMAAAVIVVRDGADGLEVLVGQRTTKARFMGGFWVFPGGRVEPTDGDGEAAWPVAAAREVREEVGISVPVEQLRAYDRWVTPEALPKRFDTVFFLAPAPDGAEAVIDGEEIVDSRWATPTVLLRDVEAGTAVLAFPTMRQLEDLARHASVAEAVGAAPTGCRTRRSPCSRRRRATPSSRSPVRTGRPSTTAAVRSRWASARGISGT